MLLCWPAGEDGRSVPFFPLRTEVRGGCAVEEEAGTVVVTGGTDSRTAVDRYDREGWRERLPGLGTGRTNHACGTFTR